MAARGRDPGTGTLLALGLASAVLAGQRLAASENPVPPVVPPVGMVLVHEDVRDPDHYRVPVRPFGEDGPVTEPTTGRVHRRFFRGSSPGTPLGAVMSAAGPFEASGFESVLDCAADACGGFDFRLALDVAPQPHMMVNPADFHQRTLAGTDLQGRPVTVSLLASRFGGVTHLQAVTVHGTAAPAVPVEAAEGEAPLPEPVAGLVPPPADLAAALAASLDRTGRAVLSGLEFRSAGRGQALEAAPVLDAVAALLAGRPDLSLVVVGHSDATGGLDANMRLSRARAEAVVAALVSRGVARSRLSAQGAGWLAPVASNVTEAGRAANRRVEIVAR